MSVLVWDGPSVSETHVGLKGRNENRPSVQLLRRAQCFNCRISLENAGCIFTKVDLDRNICLHGMQIEITDQGSLHQGGQ